MMQTAIALLSGANSAGFFIAALLFLRAWRRTRDPLFPFFAAAFVLFGVNEIATALAFLPSPQQSFLFLFRLGGFTLLIIAIAWKNLRPGSKGVDGR